MNPALLDTCSINHADDVAEASRFLLEKSNASMFDADSLANLNKAAVVRCIDLSIAAGPRYLSQPGIGESVGRKIIYHVMGVDQPNQFDEAMFSHCFLRYKENLAARLLSPGVVGDLIASKGILNLSAMAKADRRAKKGRYNALDLRMLRAYAEQYRPAVTLIAQYQQAMGWQPTTWDPASVFDRYGHMNRR